MRTLILAVLLAAPAGALTPGTESFLKELGIDSKAPGVVAVASDSVTAASGEVYTLDSLAAKRDEHAVKSFLVTRGFLYDFRNDPDSQFPDDEYYNILYLSVADRKFIAKTLMANFPKVPERLSPAAEKFIRGIGLDPESPDVKLAVADGTIETLRKADEPASYSLESLAKEKNESGAVKFVHARVLIHKLKTGADVPRNERGGIEVESRYLTLKERRLVIDTVFSTPN